MSTNSNVNKHNAPNAQVANQRAGAPGDNEWDEGTADHNP